jgi:hypothetical protein
MDIGGLDVLLYAPAGECIADMMLRACREMWANSEPCFQDGESTDIHPLSDPWVWRVGTTSQEFFVYRSRADASAWETEGAVPANANTMCHFLIGDRVPNAPWVVEVAVVFDKWTPEVRRLVQDLETRFASVPAHHPTTEAA